MCSRVVIVSRTGALGKLFLYPPGVLGLPEIFWFRPFVFLGDDRALVNQAPSGLGPSGFDRSLVPRLSQQEDRTAPREHLTGPCNRSRLFLRKARPLMHGPSTASDGLTYRCSKQINLSRRAHRKYSNSSLVARDLRPCVSLLLFGARFAQSQPDAPTPCNRGTSRSLRCTKVAPTLGRHNAIVMPVLLSVCYSRSGQSCSGSTG